PPDLASFPTRRSSDLEIDAGGHEGFGRVGAVHPVEHSPGTAMDVDDERGARRVGGKEGDALKRSFAIGEGVAIKPLMRGDAGSRSEEHTSELQSRENL